MDYLNAFLCGGVLCATGQLFIDRTQLTPARILTGYVVAGCFCRRWASISIWWTGAAPATVPLTGFGYSLAKGRGQGRGGKGADRHPHRWPHRYLRRHRRAVVFAVLAAIFFKPKEKR